MSHHPYLKIIIKNTFTLFNAVNLILAIMVTLVGSYKNTLFAGVAIINTLISIINGIRAQRIIDKLKLISEQNPTIERQGHTIQVKPDQVQRGDIAILSIGDQVLYDSIVKEGKIEVNESFVTGEQDSIEKRPGDQLISGSFVVAGQAKAIVKKVGADNSLNRLEHAAHQVKTESSELFRLLNNIVKYISYALIPIGALLLWARFRAEADTATAVTSTVAALVSMIPEGLILLTSSVLALATIRLSRQKVLVQDLYSIETLARVDTFALDKTGTLTTGNMTVSDFLTPDGTIVKNYQNPTSENEKSLLTALKSIVTHQMGDNATTSALRKKLLKTPKIREIDDIAESIPFSSARKYSGIKAKNGAEYLMGALEFLTNNPKILEKAPKTTDRVLAVLKRTSKSEKLLGFVIIKDELRPTASKIIQFFYDNQITPVIISGDNLPTVLNIAKSVNFKHPTPVDLSQEKSKNYHQLVQKYNIFTRVTPEEKQKLIQAFKKAQKTIAMTGDGVNDILAMKEADVSIAIGSGSDAARRSAKLVLLNSDFDTIPSIIKEGRQSINNLERSTSLFLTKTIYASILAVLFTILPLEYPFSPIEMTLLNFVGIGLPGVILALEPNTARIKNQFTQNIKRYSAPTGIIVAVAAVALAIVAELNNFTHPELTTASAFITFAINLVLIYQISRPLTPLRACLIAAIVAIFAAAFVIPPARTLFDFTILAPLPALITVVIASISIIIFKIQQKFLNA